ncbi:Synaptotagmin-1 [Chelonia mydas]|uniref:Synaptotagmin-1 n=1 Tax=Chelonia mydas TaxID=8469 RepID=M7BB41_CHEMY|nr:Synaptotagmin-1 [Chelonia mydas]
MYYLPWVPSEAATEQGDPVNANNSCSSHAATGKGRPHLLMANKMSSNSTTAPSAAALTTAKPGFIDDIINKIPLPRWALIVIAIAAGLLLILFLICIIKCCCCKKKHKKKEKLNLQNINGSTTASLVQPDMEDLESGLENEKRGRLQYSLEYNFRSQEMKVGVKQAADLKAMDSGGTSDPYVIVYLTSDMRKKYESKVYRKTLNPVFNETFTFQIPQAEMSESTLVMQIYDFNRFAKHDIIGEVRLPLGDFDLQHVIEQWQELTAANPFVKVQLILNKKKWKKKKTGVKKSTLSPYFNEAFNFEVPFNQIQNIDLVISVWDHDKVTKNQQIGKVLLGCRATGNQLRHWSDMLANPRRPIAQWHSLQLVEEVDKALGLKSHFKLPLPGK